MWRVSQTNLFKILSNEVAISDTASELETAYEEFVERLISYLDSENDNVDRIRTLNLVSLEFDMIKASELVCREKRDALRFLYAEKVISFVGKELDLIHYQMKYPKYFIKTGAVWKSPLFLNPDIINHVDVMENICGYYYTKGITALDGQSISFSQLTNGFEFLFNFKFADIYKKREEVLKRKPNKRTGFLTQMTAAIIQESREQGYSP